MALGSPAAGSAAPCTTVDATTTKHSTPAEVLFTTLPETSRHKTLMTSTPPPQGPPLPWAWIAEHAGISFSQLAFEFWLQIRLIGQPYPARHCPWCQPRVPLTASHLHLSCSTFTYRCFMAGILPAEAFCCRPPDAALLGCAQQF